MKYLEALKKSQEIVGHLPAREREDELNAIANAAITYAGELEAALSAINPDHRALAVSARRATTRE